MNKRILAAVVFCVVLLRGGSNAKDKASPKRPKFSDYPVSEIYTGKPAVPKLTKDQRTFRTMIRLGATHRVQFAGHYTVPMWGCGTSCSVFAIADSESGKVYDGFGVAEIIGKWAETHGTIERIEFHPDSRLLKINGCPNETNCGFYDYVMEDGKGLKLIRKELLPAEYQ